MNDVPAGEPVPWVDRAGKPIVPHGLRSCFRDWAGESTSYPRELAESALAHTLRDRVESAYARGDMIEKRRKMMADWATFCSRPAAPAGEVVAIRADG
jgi:integrase